MDQRSPIFSPLQMKPQHNFQGVTPISDPSSPCKDTGAIAFPHFTEDSQANENDFSDVLDQMNNDEVV